MLLYFLKTILLLGIFYILYAILLRQQKSFRWNRLYLLFTSFLAIVMPLISFSDLQKNTSVQTVGSTPLLSSTIEAITVYGNIIQHKEIDYVKLIFIGLLAGMLWGITRIAFGLYIILKMKQISSKEKIHDASVYFNSHIETPFTFFSLIFIPETFRNKEVLATILKHEQAHIALNHSLDKFYFSLLQAFCWFNPFIYLYHKEMELQHEFEADALTVQQIETDNYVKNLLEAIAYNQTPTLLVHQFFHHPLKNRITMLYKKSKNMFMQKSVVVLATFTLCSLILFFQSSAQKKTVHKFYKPELAPDTVYREKPSGELEMIIVKKDYPDSIIYETADVEAKFANGKMAMEDFIKDNLVYPEVAKRDKVEGKEIVEFVVGKDGNVHSVHVVKSSHPFLREAASDVVKSFPRFSPALIDGKPVSSKMNLPIIFKLK